MEYRSEEENQVPLSQSEQGDRPVEVGIEPGASPDTIVSTRTSRAWVRLLPALFVVVVILVFVLQNPKDVRVRLLTFSGTLPLSVALLGAVILGALMALALGSIRIFQLRKQIRSKVGHADKDDRRHR